MVRSVTAGQEDGATLVNRLAHHRSGNHDRRSRLCLNDCAHRPSGKGKHAHDVDQQKGRSENSSFRKESPAMRQGLGDASAMVKLGAQAKFSGNRGLSALLLAGPAFGQQDRS